VKKNSEKIQFSDGRSFPIFINSELDDYGLDPYEFRIYARIARRAGKKSDCFESVPEMAKGCRMSTGKVKHCLAKLLRLNLVTRESISGKASHYKLTDPSEWKEQNEPGHLATQVATQPRSPENPGPGHDTTQVPTQPRSPDGHHPATTRPRTRPCGGHEVYPFKDIPEVNPEIKDPPLAPPRGGGGVENIFQKEQPGNSIATATAPPETKSIPDLKQTSNGQGEYSARREPKSIRNVRRHYGECLPPWRVGWGVGEYTAEILAYTAQYIAALPASSAIAHYTPIQLLEEYEEKERWANLESRATNLANGHDNNGSICTRYLAEIPCPSNSEWYMENQKLDLADDLTLIRIHWERLGLEPEDSRWANWLSRAAPELDPSSGINDLPTWIIPKLATDLQNTYQPC
jgi:hypothetical protein